MIIAVLICVISLALLLQFFVSYCRSVIASSRKAALSDRVCEVAGIQDHKLRGEEFARLVQLLHLCPGRGDDRGELRAVAMYYALLDALKAALRPLSASVARWAESERESCAYFAAVVLDRRISYSRELLAQEISGSI
ncbi:MAG TPA: hypothetical protein VEJ39_07755 [Candidatus Acidoferrales bacterium]|nr:hypothetical protein [Candidatus Acidoferrales bacterium]